MKTRAGLFRAVGEPLELVELDLAEPGPDDVVVRMMDIVAALRWVNGNIEAFGGDPHNVMNTGNCMIAGRQPASGLMLCLRYNCCMVHAIHPTFTSTSTT